MNIDENNSRKRKNPTCACTTYKKSKLLYCVGPNCIKPWSHLCCAGLDSLPIGNFYCSPECKSHADALNEQILSVDYELCICKKQSGGEMIKCGAEGCEAKQYHLKCINLKKQPSKKWICKFCNERMRAAKIAEVSTSVLHDNDAEAEADDDDIPSGKITTHDIELAQQTEDKLQEIQNISRFKESFPTQEHWLKIGKSNIHARGVYAIKYFPKDILLIEYTGTRILSSERDKIGDDYIKEGIKSTYFFSTDDNYEIDATKSGNNARFINHSCCPNVYSEIIRDKDGIGHIFFYAKFEIFKGEELTLDYCFQYDENEMSRIHCKCGSKKCKKYLDLYTG